MCRRWLCFSSFLSGWNLAIQNSDFLLTRIERRLLFLFWQLLVDLILTSMIGTTPQCQMFSCPHTFTEKLIIFYYRRRKIRIIWRLLFHFDQFSFSSTFHYPEFGSIKTSILFSLILKIFDGCQSYSKETNLFDMWVAMKS